MQRKKRERRVGVLIIETARSRALANVLKSMVFDCGRGVELSVIRAGEPVAVEASWRVDVVVLYTDGVTEDAESTRAIAALPARLQQRVVIVRPAHRMHKGWRGTRTCCFRRKSIRRAIVAFAQ